MHLWRKTEVRACNHCCHAKAVSITYSESAFVALGIKHAISMRHIVICGLPGSTIYFYDMSNGTIFEKKVIEHKMCVCWFCLQFLSEIFLILRRSKRDMIKNVSWCSSKVPLFFSDFNGTWIFMTCFKVLKYQISWNIVHYSMRIDGQTDGWT